MSPENYINNTFNNSSAKRIYQKPGADKLSISLVKPLPPENIDFNSPGGVKDYCAPSPNYGKKGKEAYLNSTMNNNDFPLLVEIIIIFLKVLKKSPRGPHPWFRKK